MAGRSAGNPGQENETGIDAADFPLDDADPLGLDIVRVTGECALDFLGGKTKDRKRASGTRGCRSLTISVGPTTGGAYDPWLRSHLSVGGRMVGPCERSMVVHEPIAFWENWSSRRFEESGDYALDGAIAPVKIDLKRQTGTYEEPNVWVAYAS